MPRRSPPLLPIWGRYIAIEQTDPEAHRPRVAAFSESLSLIYELVTINALDGDDTTMPPRPDLRPLDIRQCRGCGCTDDFACDGGCHWVEDDLCSACLSRGDSVNASIALAGDRLTVTETDEHTTVVTFGEKGTGRMCGGCQLCCRLLPVHLDDQYKPAGTRCRHLRYGKGCSIHANRPLPCRTWSSRWLADPDTTGMPRPDRCHYVIDMMADEMVLQPPGDAPRTKVPAIVIWLDPGVSQRTPRARAARLPAADGRAPRRAGTCANEWA